MVFDGDLHDPSSFGHLDSGGATGIMLGVLKKVRDDPLDSTLVDQDHRVLGGGSDLDDCACPCA